MESVVGQPVSNLPIWLVEAELEARFGAELGRACWRELAAKRLDEAGAEALNRRIAERWDDIRARIAAVSIPAATILDRLQRLGAPTTPEDLHWPRDFYLDAVRHAREIRDRFTFLDLAADSGLLDTPDFV